MSSHREAPEISKDPVADNADVYAFVSPDRPDTVTILSNFVPLQDPPGGPNFFEFGDDVVYSIYIDNDGDGVPEIAYKFSFTTTLRNPNTFLYNTGPITSLDSPNWNKRQFFSVTRVDGFDTTEYGTAAGGNGTEGDPCSPTGSRRPPCNIGPRSTPDYSDLATAAIHDLPTGEKVFAGQRNDGFLVDLGAIFDLADLRPFQNLHLIPSPAAPGVDATKTLNIHTIALQIPITRLTANGKAPKGVLDSGAVLGVWSAASRRKVRMIDAANDEKAQSGPLGPGVAPRQPPVQRGARAAGPQGHVEHALSGRRQGVPVPRPASRGGAAAPGPLPGRLSPPRGPDAGAGRPRGDPADRDPAGADQRVPELHRPGAGRPAAPQRGNRADCEAQPVRPARRRPRRVPERPAGGRRRGLASSCGRLPG